MPEERTLISRCRCLGLVVLLAASLGSVERGVAQAAAEVPTLRVQILNGKTGRPVVNQKIIVVADDGVAKDAARHLGAMKTDGEGYVSVPDVSAPLVNVQVFVEAHQPCSKTGRRSFSLVKLRTSGVVSENSCRPRITLFPQAGTLVFFVRDDTFFERMLR
jgi:hypothetical protein